MHIDFRQLNDRAIVPVVIILKRIEKADGQEYAQDDEVDVAFSLGGTAFSKIVHEISFQIKFQSKSGLCKSKDCAVWNIEKGADYRD
jgi:hypothetical protein